MSTESQLLGDSLRRQVEQSKEYAALRGWELLEEDQLRDIGLSAFSGANVSGGALGQFLRAVREGKIERGSTLIIESLDRLSRQEPWKSLGLFSEIINAGVEIVTLTDGRTYTIETGLGDLLFSIVDMSRAHEESRTKSHRLSAAWANKRKNIGARKLTAQCPGWLRLATDKKSFHVIQDRREIVIRIFEDSAAGIGIYSITKRLNEARIPTFGRSNGWHSSFVAKILGSRAVLGEFQLHRRVNGKPVAEGDPIKGYFPEIIPEQLFYRAQNARSQRRMKGSGRKGLNVSNLFSGLAKCAYCKSSMRFENKGPGPKGSTYLVCEAARRGRCPEKTAWRYDHLETSFLAFVKELDLESFVRDESNSELRSELDNEIAALQGKIALMEEEKERAYELFSKSGLAADFVGHKLNDLEAKRTDLISALARMEKQRDALSSELSGFYESKEQLKALLGRLQGIGGTDVYKLRSQIAMRLRSLVSVIFVAPAGLAPMMKKPSPRLTLGDIPPAILEHAQPSSMTDQQRYFLVRFKDKSVRWVYPSDDDPLQFKEQVLGSRTTGIKVLH